MHNRQNRKRSEIASSEGVWDSLFKRGNRLFNLIAPQVETDFEELEDGSLLEMIEDPKDRSKTLFALFKNGKVRRVDSYKLPEKTPVPISRDRQIIEHVCFAG